MRSRLLLALVAVVVLALVAVASGSAVKTKVSITSGEGTHFEGTVSSPSKKCLKKRVVKLIFDTNGQLVGTATTDSEGAWGVDGSFMAGMYHAEVDPRKVGETKCRGGRSASEQY